MTAPLYTLHADIDGQESVISSSNPDVLRRFGLAYFKATYPRPELEIRNAAGTPIDHMDIWATDWLAVPTEQGED